MIIATTMSKSFFKSLGNTIAENFVQLSHKVLKINI